MYKTNSRLGRADDDGLAQPQDGLDEMGDGGSAGLAGGGLAGIAPLAPPPIHPVVAPVGATPQFLPNENMPSVDAMNKDPQLAANTAFGSKGGSKPGLSGINKISY